MPEPAFTSITQVAVVVRSIDDAVRTYNDVYGIGPWNILEFNPETVDDMVRDDQPHEHAMRLATTMVGDVMWELIEPLDERSIYWEFLQQHGEGLHHVGVGVPDYDAALASLREKGHVVSQGGRFRGTRYAYVDTEPQLGALIELIDWNRAGDATPHRTYPPSA